MTAEELRTRALRRWLMQTMRLPDERVTDINQTAPRPPAKPYATIDPELSLVTRHTEDQELPHPTTPGLIVRTSHKRLTVRVQVFGKGAAGLLSAAQDGLERYDVRDALELVGLVPIDKGTRTNLTTIQETQYEERWASDMQFSLATEATEDVSWIELVAGEGDFGGDPVPYQVPS